jgi:NADP-dependent 3-hydroxy acid dehydrogenase YdfG
MNINGIPRWPLVWITGAGTGIGRATALRLAEQGSDVVISGRRREILQQVADDARKAGYIGRILPLEMDVTQPGANLRALDWIEAQWRLPDLVVFNAGNHTPMTLDELSVETCRSLMDINFLAVMAGLEAVLPRMRKRGHGQVACVASLASYRGLPTAAAYGARGSEAAVSRSASLRRLRVRWPCCAWYPTVSTSNSSNAALGFEQNHHGCRHHRA